MWSTQLSVYHLAVRPLTIYVISCLIRSSCDITFIPVSYGLSVGYFEFKEHVLFVTRKRIVFKCIFLRFQITDWMFKGVFCVFLGHKCVFMGFFGHRRPGTILVALQTNRQVIPLIIGRSHTKWTPIRVSAALKGITGRLSLYTKDLGYNDVGGVSGGGAEKSYILRTWVVFVSRAPLLNCEIIGVDKSIKQFAIGVNFWPPHNSVLFSTANRTAYYIETC